MAPKLRLSLLLMFLMLSGQSSATSRFQEELDLLKEDDSPLQIYEKDQSFIAPSTKYNKKGTNPSFQTTATTVEDELSFGAAGRLKKKTQAKKESPYLDESDFLKRVPLKKRRSRSR